MIFKLRSVCQGSQHWYLNNRDCDTSWGAPSTAKSTPPPGWQWEQAWPEVSNLFIVQSSQVIQLPVAAGCKGKRSRCVFIEGTVPFCLQSFFFLTFIILFLYLCIYIYMYILPYTFISHLKLSQSHLVNKPGSSSSRARSNNLSPFTPGASEQGALTSSHVFLLPGPVTALFGHSIR